MQEAYDELSKDLAICQKQNNILDLEFDIGEAASATAVLGDVSDSADALNRIQQQYTQNAGFFEAFQKNDGVKKFINVALVSLDLWTNTKVADSWRVWLKEIDCFSEIPQYFAQALNDKKQKDLLLKILAGQPDIDSSDAALAAKWVTEQKDAVELNYKILAETFKQHDDKALREKAISSGIIGRILERLSLVSGEKPRIFEENKEAEIEGLEEIELTKKTSN